MGQTGGVGGRPACIGEEGPSRFALSESCDGRALTRPCRRGALRVHRRSCHFEAVPCQRCQRREGTALAQRRWHSTLQDHSRLHLDFIWSVRWNGRLRRSLSWQSGLTVWTGTATPTARILSPSQVYHPLASGRRSRPVRQAATLHATDEQPNGPGASSQG